MSLKSWLGPHVTAGASRITSIAVPYSKNAVVLHTSSMSHNDIGDVCGPLNN